MSVAAAEPYSATRAVAALGVLAALGALLHVIKGVVLLAGGPDLPVAPAMLLAFSVGLLGLTDRARGPLGALGAMAASAAALASALALLYQLQGIVPEASDAPNGVRTAYAVATAGVLFGLGLLALAARRDTRVRSPWRWLPLPLAVVWLPLEGGLSALGSSGLGTLLGGLAWLAVAVSIWPGPRLVRTVE